MATQGTDNLVIVDNMPAVEKLWNGRYRLEFFCKIQNPNEGWYSDSIDKWLPGFGTLQDADFAGEGWSARDGEAYPDMRLVKADVEVVGKSKESHLVTLTYETLTASWVAEKDEDIDYELNGLQRVSRTFVALPETSYTKVVGTSTITVGGDVLTLGAFKIEETDSMWSLTETWLESGELSRSENLESGNESISITNIGGCPTAPSGYTAVKQEERDTQGFPTCSVTFYKDNSTLSRSNDYVGSQLAETIEVFKPTAQPTPTNGGVLANKSVSNVDGIPTTRYTFLVPSVLSESEDKVGSQLAKVIEAFNEIPATPSGYVLANEQESDVEGIPTRRYTFLKPSILSRKTTTSKIDAIVTETVESFDTDPVTSLVDTGDKTVTTIFESTGNIGGINTKVATYVLAGGTIQTRTRPGPPEIPGSKLLKIVSVGTNGAVESETGLLVDEEDSKEDGYNVYSREYLMDAPANGAVVRTYHDPVEVRVPGAIQLQSVEVGIEGVSGQEGVVIDTPPSTQTIVADVEVSVETSDPARPSPPFDMGKIRCSLSMERLSLQYRGFQFIEYSDETTTTSLTGGITSTTADESYYHAKKSVTSAASSRTYPERYLIGPSELSSEFSYVSQLNDRGDFQGYPLRDIKRANLRVNGSFSPEGYLTTGVIKTKSRPIITLVDGTTYYEVIRWKVTDADIQFPSEQSGQSGRSGGYNYGGTSNSFRTFAGTGSMRLTGTVLGSHFSNQSGVGSNSIGTFAS